MPKHQVGKDVNQLFFPLNRERKVEKRMKASIMLMDAHPRG